MMMAAALHVDRKDATAQILTIGGVPPMTKP